MKTLTVAEINSFINQGFVRIDEAFSSAIAEECRSILWKATQCDPGNPGTWTKPVIRIGEIAAEPFKKAANTPRLHGAFDQLVGEGNWVPRSTLGSFPIRFPSTTAAGDTGWHVDAAFPGDDINDYFKWRINMYSKGRALLMLFLFSDVDDSDAPTLISIGSHLDVAKLLKLEGQKGLSFIELAQKLDGLPKRDIALATGKAGTVYLCHPFIIHAAQDHRGTNPKFMAQPPLLTMHDFNINASENDLCPVEMAIVKGLAS